MSEEETFPPCWQCDHPMMRWSFPRCVSSWICEACGATSVVPFGYVTSMNVSFSYDGDG